jgi:myo-inositol-1(or 4)-monophosphatase
MNYLETAVDIAREAGALLAHYYERRIGYELKGEFDLVTEADRASEKLVVERLRTHFPSHGIVAEEGGGHMFSAERGAGAYLNGRRIYVSKTARLKDSLSSTGFPSIKRHNDVNIHFYYQIAMASHGVRRTGSAAIDLAYVSCGRLDLFWEFGLKPWDMAGGVLLVTEAGGRVSDMHGAAHSVTASATLLADNGLLHEELLAFLAEIFSGRVRMPMAGIPVG